LSASPFTVTAPDRAEPKRQALRTEYSSGKANEELN
jgi:hypothetical protein